MAQTKQKPKRTFTNTAGDTLRYFRNAPAAAPSSFMFRDTTRAPQPYQDMFTQAGGPPDMDSPWAPPYPQPQRPDAYSNMHAGRDGRQFAPEMMGDLSTETIQPQGGGDIGSPPRRPGDLALSPDWARNVRQGAEDFADDAWGMMKKGATNIGDYFQNAWRGLANREPGTNLTEDLVTGIPAAARGVYDAGKGVYDAATDTGNMRGPIGDMVNMAGDRMQQWNMERQGLFDKPEMQMRGMETPPLQMPEMQEAPMPPAEPAPDTSVSPMDALGAKMTMGARDVGSAIAGAPGAVGRMGGKGIGSIFGMGRDFLQNVGEGFKEGAARQRGEVPQAQGTPQGGKREIDVSPLQGMNDPRLEKGAKVSPSQNIASTKGGFKGAFAAARKSGKKEFMYKGKKYNTRLKGQKAGVKQTAKQAMKLVNQMGDDQSPFLNRMEPPSGGQGGTSPFDYVGTMRRMFGR